MNDTIIQVINFIISVIGYLLPLPLAYLAFKLFYSYRQDKFIGGIEWVLLEIQVPRDVIKSPAVMELIFSNALYHKSKKGFWEEYVMGAPWLWFSLEIVSIDGKIHFYIRTPTRIRKLVETQIYAQFPQAKVIEVDDYVNHVPQYKKNGQWNVWGCEFTKLLHSARPIRTYRKVEELKSGTKEEFKIDPITPTLEFLGSLSKGEQVWIQIIVRQSILKFKSKSGKEITFEEGAAQDEIERTIEPYTKLTPKVGISGGDIREGRPPIFIEELIKEMASHMHQIHFDVGIRLVALANKKYVSDDDFNSLRRSSRLVFRQYAAPNKNELERVNSTQFDAQWSDPTGLALTKIKKRMLDFYRTRTFFHPPLQYSFDYPFPFSIFLPSGNPKLFVMSVEELATIYHFPGLVSETPSFKRIDSKIAKPPANLPT
jgi:hypothetical protein